jgi:hypothetical protein
MTVDDLIAEARDNRSGPLNSGALSPSDLSDFLRLALGYLLEDLDYEADKSSGGAVAARVLAALITGADETAAKALQ